MRQLGNSAAGESCGQGFGTQALKELGRRLLTEAGRAALPNLIQLVF